MSAKYNILIIGGGPAGLTAATYARRAGKSVLVLEKAAFGGQITWSPKVENFPGALSISGAVVLGSVGSATLSLLSHYIIAGWLGIITPTQLMELIRPDSVSALCEWHSGFFYRRFLLRCMY